MKYNYISWLGWYLYVAVAGFGMFILYYNLFPLYFSVIVGCLFSALGSILIPRLEVFKNKDGMSGRERRRKEFFQELKKDFKLKK